MAIIPKSQTSCEGGGQNATARFQTINPKT